MFFNQSSKSLLNKDIKSTLEQTGLNAQHEKTSITKNNIKGDTAQLHEPSNIADLNNFSTNAATAQFTSHNNINAISTNKQIGKTKFTKDSELATDQLNLYPSKKTFPDNSDNSIFDDLSTVIAERSNEFTEIQLKLMGSSNTNFSNPFQFNLQELNFSPITNSNWTSNIKGSLDLLYDEFQVSKFAAIALPDELVGCGGHVMINGIMITASFISGMVSFTCSGAIDILKMHAYIEFIHECSNWSPIHANWLSNNPTITNPYYISWDTSTFDLMQWDLKNYRTLNFQNLPDSVYSDHMKIVREHIYYYSDEKPNFQLYNDHINQLVDKAREFSKNKILIEPVDQFNNLKLDSNNSIIKK